MANKTYKSLKNDLIEGMKQSLESATPGYEVSYLAGWLRSRHPEISSALGLIDPNGDNVLQRIEGKKK